MNAIRTRAILMPTAPILLENVPVFAKMVTQATDLIAKVNLIEPWQIAMQNSTNKRFQQSY